MFNYLVDHALRNVWCTPRQDLQANVELARLTPEGGAWNQFRVIWETLKLPLTNTRFHVFQIGQLHPSLMGLFDVQNQWVSLASASVRMRLMTYVYNKAGVQMPRFETWYRVTQDRNLIVAIKHQDQIDFHCGKEPVYFRVYTNAYFGTQRANDNGPVDIWVQGATPRSKQQIITFQQAFDTYAAMPGVVFATVNGLAVNKIDLFTVKTGDVIEFVYDASIKRVVTFPVKDLPDFLSTLDNKKKYLLHYPGDGFLRIDYQDDLDLFLMENLDTLRSKGVYYHRNTLDAVRMITHKDYSIPVANVEALASDYQMAPEQMFVRLHIREAGWDRALVYENNRIHELYKLEDGQLQRALLGVDSTVENWRADNLERSPYIELMRNADMQIQAQRVEAAYGYNACSKVLADTPSRVYLYSGQPVVDVPYGLAKGTTGYEYDQQGKLLGFYTHRDGRIYPVRNSKAKYVEFLNAYADELLDEVYGRDRLALDPSVSYRFYRCEYRDGVPDNQWVDVTGTGEYSIIDNVCYWLIDTTRYHTLVRGDSIVLSYKEDLNTSSGLARLTLKHKARRNEVVNYQTMQVPMGELDIWINGYEAYPGVDYVIKFPEIYFISKRHFIKPDIKLQSITVRFSGFCKKDLSFGTEAEVGFVIHGMLSRNRRFDIRDDKVLHISVGGAYRDRSELKFSEDHPGITLDGVKNGDPYVIRDIVVPMRGMVSQETYAYRAASQVIDKRVSDYLSQYIKDEIFDTPPNITERYQLYSPFLNRLIWDMKRGILDDPKLYDLLNEAKTREICKPYEYLLAYDPSQAPNEVSSDYVVIHPHYLNTEVKLTIYQMRLISMANRVYLGNRINLSDYLTLYEEGETP